MEEEQEYFTEGWHTKEVMEQDEKGKDNETIIEMIYEHTIPSVGHIVFTNYTWSQSSINILFPFYESSDKDLIEKLTQLQQNCEKSEFSKVTRNVGLLYMPIYANCINTSELVAASSSRVYHDAKEYLNNGAATRDELYKFVSEILSQTLEPLFRSKEIRHVLKELITSLMESTKPEEKIGKEVKEDLKYQIASTLQDLNPGFPSFDKKLSFSITNFIGYFALHTIRQHCYVNFGVDGELKVYQKYMHEKSLEDLRKSKPTNAKQNLNLKTESSPKKTKKLTVKKEQKEAEDSDDYCEVIEPKSATKVPKKRAVSESSFHEPNAVPETGLLEKLDNEDLPITFKTKFRKLVEENANLRDEIRDYKVLIEKRKAS